MVERDLELALKTGAKINIQHISAKETLDLIREAKKKNHVLGVAIGNSDTDTIYNMYERNFLHISEVTDLFNGLQKEIRNIFKNI